MSHASKEERKEQKMAKKRNCRRTVDEDRIHEKAVKLRKMTDEQLVNYVEDRVEKARSEGYNRGKAHTPKKAPVNIPEIIEEIRANCQEVHQGRFDAGIHDSGSQIRSGFRLLCFCRIRVRDCNRSCDHQ